MNKYEYSQLSVRGKTDNMLFKTADSFKKMGYRPICEILSELGSDRWEVIDVRETNLGNDYLMKRIIREAYIE